jgi:hypothetical protein
MSMKAGEYQFLDDITNPDDLRSILIFTLKEFKNSNKKFENNESILKCYYELTIESIKRVCINKEKSNEQ